MQRLHQLLRGEPAERIALPAWFERVASVGIVSRDPQVVRRQRFTNIVAYAVSANAASHLVINGFYEPHELTPIHLYNAAFAVAALLIPKLHRFGENLGAAVLSLLILVGTLFAIWMLGRDSQLHVYFTLAGVLLFMFGVEHLRQFIAWFAVAFVGLLVSLYVAPEHGMLLPHDARLRQLLAAHAMINAIIINGLTMFYALASLRRTEIELENQYRRSSALVDTMLPTSVADRLISGSEQRIADHVENLSVLFADLVGFTRAAHNLPPEQVIDYLDDLVRLFDDLCSKFGVEKIKTIGDCYMAVGGLNGAAGSEARALGRLAIAMIAAQASRPPLGQQRLGLRIGIHVGDATAGIIGDTRFTYDVWGDAVNVASRMESHGLPDRIHVSSEFRLATAEYFTFEDRGVTEIRGIGRAQTYFLLTAIDKG